MTADAARSPRLLPLHPAAELSLAILVLSLAVIGGALAFQYWGGLVPCELCLAQRWPWYGAIPLAALFLARRPPGVIAPALFALIFLGSAGLAFYHAGVEQHVFAGPTACTAPKLTGSIEEMTKALMATPNVLCDQVQWSLFGISLAGWNLAASLVAVALSARAWWRIARGARA
ncbi:MAG TPA: disulfide bond formation protein B [Stellaceae bacterium]|nr:disulfide bond formation protein B [Stellaceae bacterium]